MKSVKTFLSNGTCLIVEPSASFSANLSGCLQAMGISLSQIITTKKYEEAKQMLMERKPKILVSEYEIEGYLGFALVDMQERHFPSSERISIVVTRNRSDNAVAEAAEGHVDGFILKPYSIEAFQQKLIAVAKAKLFPSAYAQKLEKGRMYFSIKKYDGALWEFSEAKEIESKPILAHYHLGRTYEALGKKARALIEYRAGRAYQPLHYKCLVAEFNILVDEKRYAEAYALVPLMINNYPITAKRLELVLTAVISYGRFQDMQKYFDIFRRIEERNRELVQVATQAFLVAGKHEIKEKNLQSAIDNFDRAVIASGRDFSTIEQITRDLISIRAYKEAEIFLGKIKSEEVGMPGYNRLCFKLDKNQVPADKSIEKGRKLISMGEADLEIFEALITLAAQTGNSTLAENFIGQAAALYPETRESLYRVFKGVKAAA